jgi:hypothetical protein
MAGPITARFRLVMQYFGDYHREIIRLLTRTKSEGLESDDADLIVTSDWFALLKPARDDLATHIANKNNPHEETIVSAGSYTPATVIDKLSKKIPNSVLPISSYGIVDELSDAQVDALWSANGWVLSCSATVAVCLGGTYYRMPASQLSLLSSDPFPANKTFYIYARIEFGYISYQARDDSPPESETVMYIGKVVTGPSGITSKQFFSVTRIETFRLSKAAIGSAIPHTGGTYESPVPLSSNWNPL